MAQKATRSDADNVKARVLHVMNMNHTKKKAEHMQQKDQRHTGHGRFPFRIEEVKKEYNRIGRNKKFQEDAWSLKD